MKFKKTIREYDTYWEVLVRDLNIQDYHLVMAINEVAESVLREPIKESETYEYQDIYELVKKISTRVFEISKSPINVLVNQTYKVAAFHTLQRPVIHPISTCVPIESITEAVESYGYDLKYHRSDSNAQYTKKYAHKLSVIDSFNAYILCERKIEDCLAAISNKFPQFKFRIDESTKTIELLDAKINSLIIQGDKNYA